MTAILVTSYWGDTTTEDAQLRRQYEQARDSLEPKYNAHSSDTLVVYDLTWLPGQESEHFLVRGSAADSRIDEPKLSELVATLLNDDQPRAVGTGLALYGASAVLTAGDVSLRVDPIKPRGLRFLAHEYSVSNLGEHLAEWMEQAANDILARASATDSERFIDLLTFEGPQTAREQKWDI